jgi:hypothetical protein
MSFKVDFDITNYRDILPRMDSYTANDFIINADYYNKGDTDSCVWKKYVPSASEITSQEFRVREARRVLKTGAWVCIKETIVWLPPSYYMALQYGKTGDDDLQFRLKRLKHVYFKLQARANPACIGTFTIKNRQDGETTTAVTDGLWECADGAAMKNGQVAIQSKTRADAINPCWMTVQTMWQTLPMWLKEMIYSDFSSGENIAEKIRFMRNADEAKDIAARNVLMTFYPAVYNAMDGKNNVKKCILDEVLKWVECHFGETLTNYRKFIMPGMERRGMFDIFSSPSDKDCQSYRDGYELWKISDPNVITENGTTESRIHRYYSNPLEGIQGAYDKWGDADPQFIYDHIMRERKNTSKDKLLGEIRGFPLNEEEMWGSIEGGSVWSNTQGLKERSIYLMGTRFKSNATKEPKVLYGNLEWSDGIVDSDVDFRQADIDRFDLQYARFAISYLPQNREPLKKNSGGQPDPPPYVESCLGIDPIDKRYATRAVRGYSNAGMVCHKFRDLLQTGINKCPTLLYSCRPSHSEIFFEDAIKAAVFSRSLVQTESINSKIIDYFEDRNYFSWLLSKRGEPKNSKIKGDSPSGKGMFLTEMMGLIDSITNTPLTPESPYLLENFWFRELIDDLLKFNPKDTHENDLSMAFGQSLMGAAKIIHQRVRQPSEVGDAFMAYLFD